MIKKKYTTLSILIFIGSLSLSLEWVLKVIGDSVGISLNWIVFPVILLLDIASNSNKYLNQRVLRWVFILLLPLILFYLFTNDVGIPSYLTRFKLVKAGFNAVIIFVFFMVNSETSTNRLAVLHGLVFGGMIGIFVQIAGIAGFLTGAIHYNFLKGLDVGMNRVAALGDVNQSLIYVLSVGAYIFWNNYLGEIKQKTLFSLLAMLALIGFVASTGSRAGTIAVFLVSVLSFYFSAPVISKSSRLKILFVLIGILIFLVLYKSALLNTIKVGLFERWLYAAKYSDDSVGHRVGAYEWLLNSLMEFPHLIGVGYYTYGHEVRKYIPEWIIRWPHSSVVDSYIIGGIPFFITYLYLWAKSFLSLFLNFRSHRKYKIGIEAGFFLILLTGVFIITISLSIIWIKITWAVLGVSFGFQYGLQKNRALSQKGL